MKTKMSTQESGAYNVPEEVKEPEHLEPGRYPVSEITIEKDDGEYGDFLKVKAYHNNMVASMVVSLPSPEKLTTEYRVYKHVIKPLNLSGKLSFPMTITEPGLDMVVQDKETRTGTYSEIASFVPTRDDVTASSAKHCALCDRALTASDNYRTTNSGKVLCEDCFGGI